MVPELKRSHSARRSTDVSSSGSGPSDVVLYGIAESPHPGHGERNLEFLFASFPHAAFAISDTRSNVVAFMLDRASIRSSHATRLKCGAPSSAHSGVWVKRPTAGATRRSAS